MTANLKQETPDGGHVQVVGPGNNTPSGHQKAEAVMSKKCPGGYDKLKWGMENTGTMMGTSSMSASAIPLEAYFVDFKCK